MNFDSRQERITHHNNKRNDTNKNNTVNDNLDFKYHYTTMNDSFF